MKRNVLLVSAVAAVLVGMMLSSCGPVEEYEIKMTPKGNSLERSVAVHTNAEGGFSEAQLDRLVKIYNTPSTSKPGATQPTSSYSAEATFTDKTPDDVGGAGRYKNITADMGDLTFYVERFRGTDDLDAQLTDRLKAADRMAELIAGWIESQVKDPADKKTLKAFLDGQFRKDIRNISLYAWTNAVRHSAPTYELDKDGKIVITNNDPEKLMIEFLARLGLYLDERGYMSAAEFQAFLEDLNKNSPNKLLQRILTRKIGVPDDKPTPKSLAFLDIAADASASFGEFLKNTDEYKKLMADWQKSPKDDKGNLNAELSPHKVIEDLIDPAFKMGRSDQATVNLSISLPEEPVYTNGLWIEKKKELAWMFGLSDRDDKAVGLPSFAYAIWTKPNSDFQTAHLGKVVLTGKQLYEYITWRKELSTADGKDWDAFIAGLKPGADLEAKLGAFRFKSDSTTMPQGQTELPPGKASGIISNILASLKQPTTQPTQPSQP